MAMLPLTLLLLSVYCLGIQADKGTCPSSKSLEDKITKIQLLLNEVKDDQARWINCTMHCSRYIDCQALYKAGHTTSGIYTIKPDGVNETDVYCEMDGGGWTVFQRRIDGSVDFYRDWATYAHGFGNVSGEYWLGNDYIHALTKDHQQMLKVVLHQGGKTVSAKYSVFYIDDEAHNYKLTVEEFLSGSPPGDSLGPLNGASFSTWDKDNDLAGGHCSMYLHGAWWYRHCHWSNLNGDYKAPVGQGVFWQTWNGRNAPSKLIVRMMIKAK